jgi:hypothetical protein
VHATVHHVARRDDIRACLDVRHRGAGEQLEALVVVHVTVDDHAAVAVRGVLAEAHVGHEHELGEARTERTERALHDAVVLPRAGRLLVLLLGDAEEDHRLHAETDELLDLADGVVHRVPRHPGQFLVAPRFRRHEEWHHELVKVEAGLADE